MIPVEDLRYEVKMAAPEGYLLRLLAQVRVHPLALRKLHPQRWVNNVYLDSRNLSRLNQNYAGVGDRSKLRYRWYGEAMDGAGGHLEFKLKHGALGWKRSFPVTERVDLRSMSWNFFVDLMMRSVPEDVRSASQTLDQPVIINRYLRSYLITANRAVRVTIDTHQKYWNQWATTRPNLRFATQPPGTLVVEVKAQRGAAEQVGRVLQGLPLLVTKNSKYVVGCEHLGSLG
jgi:hypothetical protein